MHRHFRITKHPNGVNAHQDVSQTRLTKDKESFSSLGSKESSNVSSYSPKQYVTSDVFSHVILPLLYETMNEKQMYSISMEESEALRNSFASPGAVLVSKANSNQRHNLTYGEVLPSSIESAVLPELGPLGPDDVFYDLGSGTGKIPLQVAMQTNVGQSKGIEYAQTRHDAANAAYERISQLSISQIMTFVQKLPNSLQTLVYNTLVLPIHQNTSTMDRIVCIAQAIYTQLQQTSNRIQCIRGDFCKQDISDATVIFINNAVFEPDLMLTLLEQLATLPYLRRIVCLRKLCYRHGRRCQIRQNPCVAFGHPIKEQIINPTWCDTTTLFTYKKESQANITRFFAASSQQNSSRMKNVSSKASSKVSNPSTKASNSTIQSKTKNVISNSVERYTQNIKHVTQQSMKQSSQHSIDLTIPHTKQTEKETQNIVEIHSPHNAVSQDTLTPSLEDNPLPQEEGCDENEPCPTSEQFASQSSVPLNVSSEILRPSDTVTHTVENSTIENSTIENNTIENNTIENNTIEAPSTPSKARKPSTLTPKRRSRREAQQVRYDVQTEETDTEIPPTSTPTSARRRLAI